MLEVMLEVIRGCEIGLHKIVTQGAVFGMPKL